MKMQTANQKIETIIIGLKTDRLRETETKKNQDMRQQIEN